jgi:hypothetical protein
MAKSTNDSAARERAAGSTCCCTSKSFYFALRLYPLLTPSANRRGRVLQSARSLSSARPSASVTTVERPRSVAALSWGIERWVLAIFTQHGFDLVGLDGASVAGSRRG